MRTCIAAFLVLCAGPGILSAQIDANANGISDIYERHFNGGQLFGPTFTATADHDADGHNNLQESVAGTDPLKFNPPEGHLVQTIRHVPATWGQEPGQPEPILLTPEAFEVGWQAVAGKQYTLSCSPSLEGGSWLPVGDPIYGYAAGPIVVGCIPDAGGGQMPDKFFWRVEAGDIDSDADLLTDYEEALLGTYYWVSETFPGIPDIWIATQYTTAQGFDYDADDDNDGLTNFDEYLNGASPHAADSDGDGTADGAEVNQGSNPNNNADGGTPPEDPIEEVEFTVGGDFAFWRMEIQGQGPRDHRLLRHTSPAAGATVDKTFKLHRNNKYEITLHRVGGYPDWYCWEAAVSGLPGEETFVIEPNYTLGERNENARFFSVAGHWLVDNRDGLLTSHLDSEYEDKATGLKAVLVPIEFKKMWETNNKANQIMVTARRDDPNTPAQSADADGNLYGTPRNLLYVTAAPGDNKYHVSLDCELGLPRDQFVCAAYLGPNKVGGTDTVFPPVANEPANLLIPATGADQNGQDFTIKIAVDENQNGQIDVAEVAIDLTATKSGTGVAMPPMLRGFSLDAVNAAIATMHGQATGTGWTGWKPNWVGDWFVPNAIALERLFYEGTTINMGQTYQPNAVINPEEPLNAFGNPGDFNEWLTHHAGANFSAEGLAKIKHYYWNSSTPVANLISMSSPLRLLKDNTVLITQMEAVTSATVDSFKQSNIPAGEIQTFPPGPVGYDLHPVLAGLGAPHASPAWVPAQTLLIGDQDGYASVIPDDAFGTVGRSRFMNGQYRFVVKKENRVRTVMQGPDYYVNIPYSAVVVYLRISGTSHDLYDFNHNSAGLSVPAAITQLSYGNGGYGRTNGVVYRTTVDILKDYLMLEIAVN